MSENTLLSGLSVYNGVNVELAVDAKIGVVNIFSGDFSIRLMSGAVIANFSTFKNSGINVIPQSSNLILGENSKLTSHHYFDLSSDIIIGNNSVLGGRDIQVWTHGFVHFDLGKSRYIKFGNVVIGDGVYIGARCTLNPGVKIGNGICFAASSSIAGNYDELGFYAPHSLRKIGDLDKDKFMIKNTLDLGYKCGNPMFEQRLES